MKEMTKPPNSTLLTSPPYSHPSSAFSSRWRKQEASERKGEAREGKEREEEIQAKCRGLTPKTGG
jgi:hypothetical protein